MLAEGGVRWLIGSMVNRGFCDGLTDRLTDGQTDICDSRVAFVTESRSFRHLYVELELAAGSRNIVLIVHIRIFS